MTADPFAVVAVRIEERLKALDEKMEAQNRLHAVTYQHLEERLNDIKRTSSAEVSGARIALEEVMRGFDLDLTEHKQAVNPHPPMEEWMRRRIDDVDDRVDKIDDRVDALSNQISEARGASTATKWLVTLAASEGVAIAGLILQVLHHKP